MFKEIMDGIREGLTNTEIAKKADVRMPGESKYHTKLVKELRKIYEAKKPRDVKYSPFDGVNGTLKCPIDNKETWLRHCRQHCILYVGEEHHGNNYVLICGGDCGG